MTQTLQEHAALNWAYILGVTAKARGYPIEACPRNLPPEHKVEWLRGFAESKGEAD